MNQAKKRQGILLVVALAAMCQLPPSASAQVDQQALAQRISGGDLDSRIQALEWATTISPEDAGPELRAAFISALVDLNTLQTQSAQRGETWDQYMDPELYLDFVQFVVELGGPETIPALLGSIGYGNAVIEALVSFGDRVIPPVVEMVISAQSGLGDTNSGLMVLTRIVERASVHPIPLDMRTDVRRAAEHRLTGRQYAGTLIQAISLAIALDDEELREIVQALASDPDEVRARGVEEPRRIARVQQRAVEALGRRRR